MSLCLSDVFSLQMGKTPARNNPAYWGGTQNWISISDMNDKYISKTREQISDTAISETGIRLVPKGTVIMSFKLSIGKVSITAEDTYTNEAIMAFINKGIYDIDNDYLYHYLKAQDWSVGSNKAVKGSTLNKSVLEKRDISFPSKTEQQKISYKLNLADEAISKCYQIEDTLDQLVKSRFVEMFGDPLQPANSKPLGDMALLERGKFSPRPRNDPQYYNGVYPFVQTGDVANCNHRLVSYHQTLNEKGIKVSKCFSPGTILIALVGATIGATAILEIDAYAPDSLIGITPKPNVCNNVFLEVLLQFWQPELKRIAPEAARANINLGILENVPIIDADFSMQEDFAAFVREIDKSKLAVKECLEKAEYLKSALMQEYFG